MYIEVWYINLYVLCETNPMWWSKSLMDIIFGISKVLHGSGRVLEIWPYLLLSIYELQRSVIYEFVWTFQDKSNDVVNNTYGHHRKCHEDPPWIRKRSWRMTKSTFVKFWATEKCDISICMYFVRQIQWCDKNHSLASSLESGRSSLDQEGFLKDDQIYFCQFLSYREVWYINFCALCEINLMVWSKWLMDIILGVRKTLNYIFTNANFE